MNETPNFYAVIPADVRYHNALCANAKLLYGEITALCNKEGYCWAGNEYFSALYNVNIRTITRWIAELNENGFIELEVDKLSGNKRKITLWTKMSIPTTKMSIPIDKNVHTSIYSINNTINTAGKAVHFLIKNYPIRFEQDFIMPYKKQFKNDEQFNAFLNDFNDEVILSGKPFTQALFGMLTKYARNWIASKANREMKVLKNEDLNVKQANKHLDAAI